MQCFKLKTPEKMDSSISPFAHVVKQKEAFQHIYEQDCKTFDFDGRDCLQIMHFETKMVIYLIDWKIDEIEYAVNAVAEYLIDMYKNDKQMQEN